MFERIESLVIGLKFDKTEVSIFDFFNPVNVQQPTKMYKSAIIDIQN